MTSSQSRPTKPQVRPSTLDQQLVATLSRYHGATAPLLMQRYFSGQARSGVYKRLARLVRIGLLEDLATGPSNRSRPRDVPALYVPTRTGLAWVASDLPATPIPLATMKHTLAVAEAGLYFEALVPEGTVTTDREMRQRIATWRHLDGSATPVGVPWMGSDELGGALSPHWGVPVKVRTHCPDLVVDVPGEGRTAIEVELTAKSEQRLRQTLEMYGRASKYRHVRYLVPDERMERLVGRTLASIDVTMRPQGTSIDRLTFLHQ